MIFFLSLRNRKKFMIGWWIIGLCLAGVAVGFYVWKQTQSTRCRERDLIRHLERVGVPALAIHHNLLIACDRRYVRIGVVVVLQSGLIVLDALPCAGEVVGEGQGALWRCRKGSRVHTIRNPFTAINRQIAAIRQNLEETEIPAYSVVVLPDKSQTSIADLPSDCRVIHWSELGEMVNEILSREGVFDEEQLRQILLVLKLGAYHGADARMQAQVEEETI